MSILCDQCGEAILPLANFCSYCGTEAPHKTVILKNEKQEPFENPVYCTACGKPAPYNALYCAFCGEYLYQLPKKNTFYCPKCKEKNNINAKNCSSCGLSFVDWFSMKGIVADNLGLKGNIILHETMNDMFYHFICNNTINIGRNSCNDIIIPCPWISSNHCKLDIQKNLFVDLNSKNGTYINRNNHKINSTPLDSVFEFNLAGSFTFTVTQIKNAFIFRLTAILNQKECEKISNMKVLDELRKHYYILLSDDINIDINMIDGIIEKQPDEQEEAYHINIINKFYYFSDLSRKINNRLILKKYKNIPVNWEII